MTVKEFYNQYGVYGLPWWQHGEEAVAEGRCFSIRERDAVAQADTMDVPIYRFTQRLDENRITQVTVLECVGFGFLDDCK